MTFLEAIKEAEEKQKTLSENTAKIYIRRRDWANLIDPVDFLWMYTPFNINKPLAESNSISILPFHKTNIEFKPNKVDIINNDWELFTYYFTSEAESKNNKESKPESTSIPKENITNSIKQIRFAKERLEKLSEDAVKIKKMFEKNYGVDFNYFIENPTILVDRESSVLYFFAEVTKTAIKEVDDYLNKAIIKINETELTEKSNKEKNKQFE